MKQSRPWIVELRAVTGEEIMNRNAFVLLSAVALCFRLATPNQLAAQQQGVNHHHYKLIDMGTLGGPNSSVNEAAIVVSSLGTVVGGADTSTPDPNSPNSCLFCGAFVTHAFQWRDGVRTDLGALPGVNSSFAQWTSDSGFTVGYSEDSSLDPLLGIPEVHAVLWTEGRIMDLGTLQGGHESAAFSVNSRGQVAGISQNLVPDPFNFLGTEQHAFLWEKGAMKDLGTLGGPDAGLLGIDGNIEINERGHVVACSYTSTVNPATGFPTVEPFLWEPDTMIDLGSFGGTSGCAIFLNNRDQVVGYSNLAGDVSHHPFLWERGRPLVDLGTLGGQNGIAFWINDPGEVVGDADVASPPGCVAPNCFFHAFFWRHGVMKDIGTLAGTDNSNGAAINSRSQVVGASFTPNFSVVDAFLWEEGSLADLNSLVSPPSALHLNVASDINDRGEIAGFGFLPGGEERAFLLVPCDENHPSIESCDYSLVEGSAVAALTSLAPVTQDIVTTNPKLPGLPGLTMRSLHRWTVPRSRGLGAQSPK
jgi:probable HAF family extracellular repeat protein